MGSGVIGWRGTTGICTVLAVVAVVGGEWGWRLEGDNRNKYCITAAWRQKGNRRIVQLAIALLMQWWEKVPMLE